MLKVKKKYIKRQQIKLNLNGLVCLLRLLQDREYIYKNFNTFSSSLLR